MTIISHHSDLFALILMLIEYVYIIRNDTVLVGFGKTESMFVSYMYGFKGCINECSMQHHIQSFLRTITLGKQFVRWYWCMLAYECVID